MLGFLCPESLKAKAYKNSGEMSIPREQPTKIKNENCRPGLIESVHQR